MNTAIKMDTIPNNQIQIDGINVLKKNLGVVKTIRFLEQFDNGGIGDYTKEKCNLPDEQLTKDELLDLFK